MAKEKCKKGKKKKQKAKGKKKRGPDSPVAYPV